MLPRTAFCKRGTSLPCFNVLPGKTPVPDLYTFCASNSSSAQPSVQCLVALGWVGALVPGAIFPLAFPRWAFVCDPPVAQVAKFARAVRRQPLWVVMRLVSIVILAKIRLRVSRLEIPIPHFGSTSIWHWRIQRVPNSGGRLGKSGTEAPGLVQNQITIVICHRLCLANTTVDQVHAFDQIFLRGPKILFVLAT